MVESSAKTRLIKLNDSVGMGIITHNVLKAYGADGTMDYLFSKCIEHGVKFEDD